MVENGHHDYTPYAYVYNNPVNFIDPLGLDTFLVDNKGKFANEPIEGGDDDVIVKVSKKERKNGKIDSTKEHESENFDKGSIKVEQKKDENNRTNTIITSSNEDQTEAIFNFLADNTKVEYSHMEMTDKEGNKSNFITTSHQNDKDSYGTELLVDKFKSGYNLNVHTHNHPYTPTPGREDYDFYKAAQTVNKAPFKIKIRFEGKTKEFKMKE